ncbi:MAG: immunity 53 family protein [Myxococcota bacterium]|jgi:hypothetical protein|nr:immunity 53 family protein [Myxococcota bacterium]
MKESSELLEWLMTWYQSNCDGDWEHQHGIKIGTLDNPGWYIEVNLADTAKDGFALPRQLVERTQTDWVDVETKDNTFRAYGGPGNLSEIINLFIRFVEDRLTPSDMEVQ